MLWNSFILNLLNSMRGNKTVPRILWHLRFDAPWVCTAWQSVTGHFLMQVLQRLHDAVQKKRRNMQERSGVCIMHWASHCLLCCRSLQKNCHYPTTILSRSRSKRFWQFPTLKIGQKGTRFATMDNIEPSVCAELQKITKEASQQWQDWCIRCGCVCAPAFWRWLHEDCYIPYHYSARLPFREFFSVIVNASFPF